MAEAKRHLQVLARNRRPVADAVDLKLLFEALGHADHQVLNHEREVPDIARARLLSPRGSMVMRLPSILTVTSSGGGEFQFALGAFDGDSMAIQLGGDASGDQDGLFANSRHSSFSISF